ncbi:hypothetical protein ACRAWG_27860 [Methylobacterium sp. P31]
MRRRWWPWWSGLWPMSLNHLDLVGLIVARCGSRSGRLEGEGL